MYRARAYNTRRFRVIPSAPPIHLLTLAPVIVEATMLDERAHGRCVKRNHYPDPMPLLLIYRRKLSEIIGNRLDVMRFPYPSVISNVRVERYLDSAVFFTLYAERLISVRNDADTARISSHGTKKIYGNLVKRRMRTSNERSTFVLSKETSQRNLSTAMRHVPLLFTRRFRINRPSDVFLSDDV